MRGESGDEIGSFQAAPVEPGESNETDEERLQRALAMSMMDGNDNDELDLSRLCQPNRMRVLRRMKCSFNMH